MNYDGARSEQADCGIFSQAFKIVIEAERKSLGTTDSMRVITLAPFRLIAISAINRFQTEITNGYESRLSVLRVVSTSGSGRIWLSREMICF